MSEQDTEVNVLETLEPSKTTYRVVLAEGTENETVLYQKPLSFFGKIELFSVLGDAVEKALSEGAAISELLDVPVGGISTSSLGDADVFVKSIARIVKFAPDLLENIYCISLNVRKGDREYVKILLEDIDDDQGMEILNHFIDQNWDAMMDFFSKQVIPLVDKVSSKIQSRSTQSKPSKATRARTRKQ